MPDAQVVTWIAEKYTAIEADLDERARRRWVAAEARSLGWGGIAAVSAATGVSDRTIRRGILELDDPNAAPSDRQRQPGAGRKSREIEQPNLKKALLVIDYQMKLASQIAFHRFKDALGCPLCFSKHQKVIRITHKPEASLF